jgi:hypothetical protein
VFDILRKLASRPVRCGLSHDGFMKNLQAAESAERSSSGHRILLAITGLKLRALRGLA